MAQFLGTGIDSRAKSHYPILFLVALWIGCGGATAAAPEAQGGSANGGSGPSKATGGMTYGTGGAVIATGGTITADPDERLDQDWTYANVLARIGRLGGGTRYNRPVAVVLTKCDLRPDLLTPGFDIETFVSQAYPQTLNQVRLQLKTFRCFSSSAVGRVGEDRKPEMKPVGIWEPLLWLTSKL